MHRTVSDLSRWFAGGALVITALGAPRLDAAAQNRRSAPADADQGVRIISSEIAISREQAELKLELSNGRKLTLSTVTRQSQGVVQSGISGSPESAVQILSLGVVRGDELDRSWRELLNQAMDAPSDDLAGLLAGWQAPERGEPLDQLLESALNGAAVPVVGANAPADVGPPEFGDSLSKLREKISRLEEQLE
ncbi:MAG TPA: hypothetical protein VK864_03055, partial [Longimicrobiales bacterium]|nr:hypothetical protein [Longimicrobiales bacterium]